MNQGPRARKFVVEWHRRQLRWRLVMLPRYHLLRVVLASARSAQKHPRKSLLATPIEPKADWHQLHSCVVALNRLDRKYQEAFEHDVLLRGRLHKPERNLLAN